MEDRNVDIKENNKGLLQNTDLTQGIVVKHRKFALYLV